MPRLRYLAPTPGSRGSDPGYLISLSREAGLYVQKVGAQQVRLQDTLSKEISFSGSISAAVAYVLTRS